VNLYQQVGTLRSLNKLKAVRTKTLRSCVMSWIIDLEEFFKRH